MIAKATKTNAESFIHLILDKKFVVKRIRLFI
jgi:hypothetical protein